MHHGRSLLVPLAALLLVSNALRQEHQHKSYAGYVLLRTEAQSEQLGARAVAAVASHRGVRLLSVGTSARRVLFAVHESVTAKVTACLHAAGVGYSLLGDDLERILEEQRSIARALPELPQGTISFDRFLTLDEIYAYLDALAVKYPDMVTLQTIGKSTEGRDIRLLKVAAASSDESSIKPAIFIDAAIHAREWMAPCVLLYTLQQLVENGTGNSSLLAAADWYLLPVLNPDGYQFTHTTDRLWRKTRSYQGSADPDCVGVDGNRNYDYHWGGSGSSTNPCSDTFAGPAAFSEPETRAHAAFMQALNGTLILYVTLHAYGPYFLYPWGWTMEYPDNVHELDALALAATDALKSVRGTEYVTGSSANVLYFSSGSSRDYAKAVPGARFSYTLELPPGGVSGFDPPPADIWPVVTETFELVKVLAAAVSGEWTPPETQVK